MNKARFPLFKNQRFKSALNCYYSDSSSVCILVSLYRELSKTKDYEETMFKFHTVIRMQLRKIET